MVRDSTCGSHRGSGLSAASRGARTGPLALSGLAIACVGCWFELPELGSGAPEGRSDGSVGVTIADSSGAPLFVIDSTEVTNAQYAAWLVATRDDPPAQQGACTLNTSFQPARSWPPDEGREEHPAQNVDYCDAKAYCLFYGRRLCRGIGGVFYDASATNDVSKSEWYYACTAGGGRDYPYSDTFDSTSCDTPSTLPAGSTAPVGQPATCVGGFPGIFNMNGNVAEWEDACTTDSESGACSIRGGGATSNWVEEGGDLGCTGAFVRPRLQQNVDFDSYIGIRCCADPP